LYGSYARGDYDSESDIDIMAIVTSDESLIKKLRKDVVVIGSRTSLEHDIDVSVYVRNKDHFDRWKDHMPYYRNIVTEGVEISA